MILSSFFQKPEIKALDRKVWLCASRFPETEEVSFGLKRVAIISLHAHISAYVAHLESDTGATVFEDPYKSTHFVVIREPKGVVITINAWLFEDRPISGRRWFKVMGVGRMETRIGPFLQLMARQEEVEVPARPDSAPTPVRPLPEDVRL